MGEVVSLFLQAVSAPVLLVDGDRILDVNTDAAALLKCEADELIGQSVLDYVTDGYRAIAVACLAGDLAPDMSLITMQTPDDGLLKVRWRMRDAQFSDKVCQVITLERLHDHEHRLQKQIDRTAADLDLERNRMQVILEGTAEGIFYMEDFTIQYANPAFCRMLGYDVTTLIGKPLSFIREQAVQVGAVIDPFITFLHATTDVHSEAESTATKLRRRDGSEFFASMKFTRTGKPGESPVRLVAVVRDISYEHALSQQRTRFIANAAHELRTPLTALGLRLQMLTRYPGKFAEHVSSLQQSYHFLRLLVEELIDLTRFESGEVELDYQPNNLQALIREAIENQQGFMDKRHFKLRVTMPDDTIEIQGDSVYLRRLLEYLLMNAINHAAQEDEAELRLRPVKLTGNHYAVIRLYDRGTGLPASMDPHELFEPFSRARTGDQRETGLGMALAMAIAHAHGGILQAATRQRGGMVISAYLPLLRPDHETAASGR